MGSSTSALCGSDKDVTAPKRPQSGTSNRKEEPVVQAVSPLRVEPVEEARVPDLEQTEDETKPVEKIVDEKKAEPGVASEENVANEGVAVTVEALEEVVIEKVEIPASEEVALNAAPEPPTTEEEIRGVYSAEPENKVPDVVIENGLQVIESAASQEETATENENPPSADKVEQPEQTLAADAEVETENTDVPLADEPQVENELEAPVSDEPVLSTNEDSEVSAALDQPENEPEAPSKVDNDKPENEDRDPSPPEQPEVPESTESTEEPTVGSQSAEVKDDATEQPEQAKDSSEKPEETQAESAGDNELSANDNENSENQRDPTPEAA